jgi:hypothetical protein
VNPHGDAILVVFVQGLGGLQGKLKHCWRETAQGGMGRLCGQRLNFR